MPGDRAFKSQHPKSVSFAEGKRIVSAHELPYLCQLKA